MAAMIREFADTSPEKRKGMLDKFHIGKYRGMPVPLNKINDNVSKEH